MNIQNNFDILFWIKKNRIKNGIAPLSARVTINGERIELSVQRNVSVFDWDPGSQKLNSRGPEAKEINNHLAMMKSKLLNAYGVLEMRGEKITPQVIKAQYSGIQEKARTLMTILKQHNDDIKSLIGRGYSQRASG